MLSSSYRRSALRLALVAACVLVVPAAAEADTGGVSPTSAAPASTSTPASTTTPATTTSTPKTSVTATSSATATAASRVGTRTLRSGDHGTRVKALQTLLAASGFKTATDGSYGPSTVSTVRRFQRAANLKATGIASTATLTALRRATDGSAAQNVAGGASVRSVGTSSEHLGDRIPLRVGMSGHDVKVLQDYLSRAGFDTSVDGQFGAGTQKAVKTLSLIHI